MGAFGGSMLNVKSGIGQTWNLTTESVQLFLALPLTPVRVQHMLGLRNHDHRQAIRPFLSPSSASDVGLMDADGP